MKNNTSFLIVTATAVAAMALCFGSIADFGTATPQAGASLAKVSDSVSAPAAEVSQRIE